jgi:hypothetical protein
LGSAFREIGPEKGNATCTSHEIRAVALDRIQHLDSAAATAHGYLVISQQRSIVTAISVTDMVATVIMRAIFIPSAAAAAQSWILRVVFRRVYPLLDVVDH